MVIKTYIPICEHSGAIEVTAPPRLTTFGCNPKPNPKPIASNTKIITVLTITVFFFIGKLKYNLFNYEKNIFY